MNYSVNFRGALDKAAGLASRTGGLVCTEHLLYGLAAQGGCNAQRMLASAGVDAEAVLALFTLRDAVARVAMSTRANRAVSNATALARQSGADTVNTEHLLFAVIYDSESVAAQVLEKRWGIDIGVMRAKLWHEISGEGRDAGARQQRTADLELPERKQGIPVGMYSIADARRVITNTVMAHIFVLDLPLRQPGV